MTSKNRPQLFLSSVILLCLSIAVVVILFLTGRSTQTSTDEIATGTGAAFMASCIASLYAARGGKGAKLLDRIADYLFMAGMVTLFTAVIAYAYGYL